MTNEMIRKLEEMGAKRWTKGNYDRLYISLEMVEAICNEYNDGVVPMNRRAKGNFKLWIDIETGEVKSQGIGNYADDIENWTTQFIDDLNKEEENAQELQPVAHYEADNGDAFTVYEPSTAVFAQVPTIKCYAKRSDIPVPHLNYYADEACKEFICTAGTHVRPALDKSMMFQQFVYDHRSSSKEVNDTITDTLYEEA